VSIQITIPQAQIIGERPNYNSNIHAGQDEYRNNEVKNNRAVKHRPIRKIFLLDPLVWILCAWGFACTGLLPYFSFRLHCALVCWCLMIRTTQAVQITGRMSMRLRFKMIAS